MRIMFVCTGNICRSPMGELLLGRYLAGTSVRVSSAGTHGLPSHRIDPSCARLLDGVGVASDGFRSRRLTAAMARQADLILCFEKAQRRDVVMLAPSAVCRTFLLTEFAAMCRCCAEAGAVRGVTIGQRLRSVVDQAPAVRPSIPEPDDIEDPHGREPAVFHAVAERTNAALCAMLAAMRKHYRAPGASAPC